MIICCGFILGIAGQIWLQNGTTTPPAPTQSAEAPSSTTKPAEPNGPILLEQLERNLAQTLTNSVFTGTWQLLEGDSLSAPKPEKYTIVSARKLSGDLWLITARIEFADKDVTVPLPLRIVWAGDTPIITVTDLHVPGIGKYSARVMIYRDLYSGAWFGEGHGGLLSGRITRPSADAEPAPARDSSAAPAETRPTGGPDPAGASPE